MTNKKFSRNEKALMRRYLVWCYKTTKEDLDRIDRKFTQIQVDRQILKSLNKSLKNEKSRPNIEFLAKIKEFEKYIQNKETSSSPTKYIDSRKITLQPSYWYLKNRLQAVEHTIRELLGVRDLNVIQKLYEDEMTARILQAREHT